jgi:hypothetical protein
LVIITGSSNIKLDNIEVFKLSDSYELYSKKISVIFEEMGHYKIDVFNIDPLSLTIVAKLMNFQLDQEHEFLIII